MFCACAWFLYVFFYNFLLHFARIKLFLGCPTFFFCLLSSKLHNARAALIFNRAKEWATQHIKKTTRHTMFHVHRREIKRKKSKTKTVVYCVRARFVYNSEVVHQYRSICILYWPFCFSKTRNLKRNGKQSTFFSSLQREKERTAVNNIRREKSALSPKPTIDHKKNGEVQQQLRWFAHDAAHHRIGF